MDPMLDTFGLAFIFACHIGVWILWEAPLCAQILIVTVWGLIIPKRVSRSRTVWVYAWQSLLFVCEFWNHNGKDCHGAESDDGGLVQDALRVWFFLSLPIVFLSSPDIIRVVYHIVKAIGWSLYECFESVFRKSEDEKVTEDGTEAVTTPEADDQTKITTEPEASEELFSPTKVETPGPSPWDTDSPIECSWSPDELLTDIRRRTEEERRQMEAEEVEEAASQSSSSTVRRFPFQFSPKDYISSSHRRFRTISQLFSPEDSSTADDEDLPRTAAEWRALWRRKMKKRPDPEPDAPPHGASGTVTPEEDPSELPAEDKATAQVENGPKLPVYPEPDTLMEAGSQPGKEKEAVEQPSPSPKPVNSTEDDAITKAETSTPVDSGSDSGPRWRPGEGQSALPESEDIDSDVLMASREKRRMSASVTRDLDLDAGTTSTSPEIRGSGTAATKVQDSDVDMASPSSVETNPLAIKDQDSDINTESQNKNDSDIEMTDRPNNTEWSSRPLKRSPQSLSHAPGNPEEQHQYIYEGVDLTGLVEWNRTNPLPTSEGVFGLSNAEQPLPQVSVDPVEKIANIPGAIGLPPDLADSQSQEPALGGAHGPYGPQPDVFEPHRHLLEAQRGKAQDVMRATDNDSPADSPGQSSPPLSPLSAALLGRHDLPISPTTEGPAPTGKEDVTRMRKAEVQDLIDGSGRSNLSDTEDFQVSEPNEEKQLQPASSDASPTQDSIPVFEVMALDPTLQE